MITKTLTNRYSWSRQSQNKIFKIELDSEFDPNFKKFDEDHH